MIFLYLLFHLTVSKPAAQQQKATAKQISQPSSSISGTKKSEPVSVEEPAYVFETYEDMVKALGENALDDADDLDDMDEDGGEEWYEEEDRDGEVRIVRGGGASSAPRAANPSSGNADAVLRRFQPSKALEAKLLSRIHIGDAFEGRSVSNTVSNSLRPFQSKEDAARIRVTGKSDRATVEQVLDPRTRMILFKLLNQGIISEINGCVSTGKEANVYHALGPKGVGEYAIKVYKTSILVFKDRDRYVTGEFRFRHGYSKSNPRKRKHL